MNVLFGVVWLVFMRLAGITRIDNTDSTTYKLPDWCNAHTMAGKLIRDGQDCEVLDKHTILVRKEEHA